MKCFIFFCIAGGLGFATDLIVFTLSGPLFGYYLAKVLGFIVAVQLTFFLNKKITFNSQRASYWLYIAGQSKGFLINFCTFASVYAISLSAEHAELISFTVASLVTLLFNYFYAKKWVFQSASSKDMS